MRAISKVHQIRHLAQICNIAKRSDEYLVDQRILFQDTGKWIWRHKTALKDIITYLRRCDQAGSITPLGSVTSRLSCSISDTRFVVKV